VISLPAIPTVAGYGSIVVGVRSPGCSTCGTRNARRSRSSIRSMFRLPLFRSAIIGGSLFRVGIGAFPFLMPLMLQLTFGLSAVRVGAHHLHRRDRGDELQVRGEAALRCVRLPADADGDADARLLLSRHQRLVHAGYVPHWLLMGALLFGGLTRSFFFTGVNALVFADVDEAHASQATAINAVRSS
jgi:hypothetical protein